jgi:NADH-quinone oxidoreductase subunit E
MLQTAETEVVAHLVGQFEGRRSSLIPILQEIQETYRYLPQPVLRQVSERLHIPLPEVYHVATFYNCFSLEPVGRNLVQVCMGTACHVRGAPKVLDRLLTELRLGTAGTTEDREFTVRTVRCIGCCGLAPVVRVNSNVHHHLTQAKVKGMLKKYYSKQEVPVAG